MHGKKRQQIDIFFVCENITTTKHIETYVAMISCYVCVCVCVCVCVFVCLSVKITFRFNSGYKYRYSTVTFSFTTLIIVTLDLAELGFAQFESAQLFVLFGSDIGFTFLPNSFPFGTIYRTGFFL